MSTEKQFRIRCSSLSAVMADPISYPRESMSDEELAALASKKRTPEQIKMLNDVMARSLSEGAKTFLHDLVRRHIYNYDEPELTGKEVRKGHAMEGGAIALLSAVTGDLLTKNNRFFDNGWLCGTPDCWDSPTLYDTKCPWSIESFPMVASVAEKMARGSGYEWQMRGYMLLLNNAGIHVERAGVSYCLMETPSDLIPQWEDSAIHDIPLFLPPEKRVTIAWFERDLEIEARIEKKCKAAQAYAETLIQQFRKEKGL